MTESIESVWEGVMEAVASRREALRASRTKKASWMGTSAVGTMSLGSISLGQARAPNPLECQETTKASEPRREGGETREEAEP